MVIGKAAKRCSCWATIDTDCGPRQRESMKGRHHWAFSVSVSAVGAAFVILN
ncbi:hypothetical protein CGRA01v4_13096 [Colletotrichum graminicola]|nr:hypothetical protein CGRA01v4_13096 [Colletotrichum graminicola]